MHSLAGDIGDQRVLDETTLLDVHSLDLGEGAVGRVVVREELGHHCEWLGCVNCETWAIEIACAEFEGIVGTS